MRLIVLILLLPVIAFSQVPDTLVYGKQLKIHVEHDLTVQSSDTTFRSVPADSIDFDIEIRDSNQLEWFRLYRVPVQGEESVYEKRSDNLDVNLDYQVRARAVFLDQYSDFVKSNWIAFMAPDTTEVVIETPTPVIRIIINQD